MPVRPGCDGGAPDELSAIDQSLFDSLSAHIALVGESGVILRVNAAWRRFARDNDGALERLLEGADYLGICEAAAADGCETAAQFVAGLRAVLAGTSEGFTLEYACDSPAERRWFVARLTPFITAGRRRAVVAHEDISGRRLAEQQLAARERHFSSLLASGLDLIATIDANGEYLYVSPSYETALGYRPEELVGTSALALIHPDDAAQAAAAIRAGVEQPGTTMSLEFRVRHRDGSWRVIESFGKSIDDQLPIVGILNSRDITERKRAEEALRQSEDRFRSAFENAPIGVAIVDLEGRFVQVNRAFCDIVGYAPEALVHGTMFRDITHLDDIGADLQALREMLAGERTTYAPEKRYIHRAGHVVHVRLRTSLVRDGAGAPLHFISQAIDVSEQKRVEIKQRRLVRAVEAAAEGIVLTDVDGRVLQVNPAFTRLTGYAQDVIGQRAPLLQRALSDPDTAAAFWGAIRAGETWAGRLTERRPDGTLYYDAVTVAPIVDDRGTLDGFVGIHRDVTEDIQREEALADALQRAESATQAKSEFLANMSHEIRTPMNGILGMTELALATPLNGEQREYLELAKTSADSLLGIIGDILDFSKIEAGKLTLDPGVFDLRSMLDTTLKTLGVRAREKGIALTWQVDDSVPAALIGDVTRLRQVITNLVGNGLKFTTAGSVEVRAAITERRDDTVELHVEVADTGGGIAPERQERIFEAFEQVDASISRRFGGTGLGLTISARLVGMMGGRIWVESALSAGSVFHFTAVLGQAHDGAAAAKPDLSHGQTLAPARRVLRVLLAEDNAVNQRLVLRLLEKRGHGVVVAVNGREALAAVERESFDAILMDVQMPEMDGFEATAALRAREVNTAARIPIIAMTAHAMKGDRERCLAAGMDDYITKPIRGAELFAVLEALAGDGEVGMPQRRSAR